MISKFTIPKESLIPQIKEELVPALKKELEAKGVTGFRFIDAEWVKDGLIIYYEESSKPQPKAKKNNS